MPDLQREGLCDSLSCVSKVCYGDLLAMETSLTWSIDFRDEEVPLLQKKRNTVQNDTVGIHMVHS